LERVRARTRAMQHSDELAEASSLLFQQMKALGVSTYSSGFTIWNEDKDELVSWMCNADGSMNPPFILPLIENTWHIDQYNFWKNGKDFAVKDFTGLEMQSHFQYLRSFPLLDEAFKKSIAAGHPMPERQVHYVANFSHGNLLFITLEPYPEAEELFKRFAKVFEQTYTRFLDLQKAEAQTKEAKIEAALEKIRSRTMGMQSSDELPEVANLLFAEVRALGIHAWSCGYNILAEDKKAATCCMSSEGTLQTPFQLRLWGEASFDEMGGFVQSDKIILVQELGGKALEEHYAYMKSFPDLKPTFDEIDRLGLSLPIYQINHLCKFTQGFILFITYEKVPDSHDVFKRFTHVFDQTYTRFLDLQRAEAQASEAIKRASVDRVRAEIASMRTTGDLERIQPLIWNELKILGVPFIRCGVFIMDEERHELNTLLSTPDGKAIAAFRLPYHSTHQSTQIVSHWHQKQLFKDHMDEAAFAEYTQNLVQMGVMPGDEKYVTENRPNDLFLHFLPFMQGMLYVGNTAPLSDNALQLVQNLADAFSTAYARYEDFNKLEAAKAEVEAAMSELKATQSQLVQQEKLASLGQLTAGIAHEIKNPLNFVNNFSEVSLELIDETLDEMRREPETRDETIVNENLAHIKSNIKKVLDHGTRANSIVNAMLMHSRQGTGKPEPTMLNDFIHEYSNLAYHGMRAGNHPLDVKMIFDLDENIEEVPLIAEDFSRVVLNICNNAFDAMRSTPKPTFTIRTQLQKHSVIIRFEDNGPGIPDAIRDKILQPFFTTKKGTEGTGLGLSISNDIVKAHGGELQVETKKGGGSTFTIQLPTN